MGTLRDPVTPHARFENSVVPGGDSRRPAWKGPKIRLRVNRMSVFVGTIAVLPFVLGVMVTLNLMGPRKTAAAAAAVPSRAVNLSGDALVTRQQPPDLTSTVVPVQKEPMPELRAAVLQGLQPVRTVGKLTQDELAEKALQAQEIVSRNKLRMLREGVLAGVYTVKMHEDDGIRRLVLTTVNAEMTRRAMGNLLLKAAADGAISIPASLSTAEGSVDMDTMLFNLIQTSLANDGTVEGREAATEMSRRAFAASSATTQDIAGSRIYVVEPGDSLAYLSLQFYGRPNAYPRIYEANREQLRSPDLIQVGQRLIIPRE